MSFLLLFGGKSDLMNIPAKKSLGQNFLKDETILKKISESFSVSSNDLILEIGPGKGALTKYLLQKGCQYVAYEIDERMKPILSTMTSHVIYQDFLKSNLMLDLQSFSYDHLYVIANIPYYITTPIIEHIMNFSISLQEMVLLVQKEVADRFVAQPHTRDYGYFTVYLNYYFEMEKIIDVARNCFDPIPNVDSAVVKFKRKETTKLNEQKYFSFLKVCFLNKRKTLRNNLKNYDWNKILYVLQKYQLSDCVRAEEVPSYVFEEIFKKCIEN